MKTTSTSLLVGGLCALSVAGLAGCGSAGPDACLTKGCGPSYHREMSMSVTEAQIRTSTLELCFNSTCTTGSFAKWTGPGRGIQFPENAEREVKRSPLTTAFVLDDTAGLELRVDVMPWSELNLKDGDVYQVRLYDTTSGQDLFVASETVTYTLHYLDNGPGCSNECLSARAPTGP